MHGDLKAVCIKSSYTCAVNSWNLQSNIVIMLSSGRFGKKKVPHIQLCDFGLTKLHDNSFGLSTNFTTTRLFEAPELRKTKAFTSASDMYAFGGVLLQVRLLFLYSALFCALINGREDSLLDVSIFEQGIV